MTTAIILGVMCLVPFALAAVVLMRYQEQLQDRWRRAPVPCRVPGRRPTLPESRSRRGR